MFDTQNRAIDEYSLVKNGGRRRSILMATVTRCLIVVAFALAGAAVRVAAGYSDPLLLKSLSSGADGLLIVVIPAVAGLLAVLSVRKMEEWERAIVLRLGRFHRVRGPGLFVMIPFADRVASVVDLRVRVSDFTAETTLTRDSVTVTVDALCFWLVWDAEKAVCEVQDYEAAVILSAKTALRSAVSSHDLTAFLENGEKIEECLREGVDRKTTDWGVTIQHVEITDIQIPASLQDPLSRLAQAEREKKGRVLLAEAEIEIARKFEEAARVYDANGTALNLKRLSILNEGLDAGNSMMIVPNSITERLEGDDLFGLQALGKMAREERAERAERAGKPRDAAAAPREAAVNSGESPAGKGER